MKDAEKFMRFLYAMEENMVRILTGTLLEVGYGRKKAEDMEAILAAYDRQMAGPTAPPHGLMLLEVEYGV